MVHVTVVFNYAEGRWTRDYDVEAGRTVLELKEQMLDPKGLPEDVESFELRLLGRRVPDFERILQDHTFDFEYLGPDLGGQRAREDLRRQSEWERHRSHSSRAPPPQTAPAPAEAPVSEPAPTPLAASAPGPLGDGEHQVAVTVDSTLGLTCKVSVRGGATILQVKERLVEQDPTRRLKVTDFGLAVLEDPPTTQAPKVLPEGTVLTSALLKLQTVDAPRVASAPIAAAVPAQPRGSSEEEEFFRPTPAPRPKVTSRPAVTAPRWEVVGGADKGGILVREGQSIKSTQLEERLATGALVEEVALEGERLRYRKISGAGPPEGWVSLSVSGKDLLVPRKPTAEDLFTLDRALSLQEELMEGFARVDFQRALSALIKEHPSKTGADFLRRRGELFLTVQSVVLPKYGFEGTPKGVVQMLAAFAPHQCGEVAWNNDQLNKLLRL